MVASQCGLPLITHGHPNTMRGMDRFSPERCASAIFSPIRVTHCITWGAETAFAGKEISALPWLYFCHRSQATRTPARRPWVRFGLGVYDDFLMEKVLERYDVLSASGAPFALVALTMDTTTPGSCVKKL